MSQENLEVVATFVEAYRRGDTEAMLAFAHENIEWRPALSPGGIEGSVYVGHDGIRRWTEELAESWNRFELSDPQYEAVEDRVLVLLDVTARGQASGLELHAALAQVYELDGSLVRRCTGYRSRAEALEAVGLSE